MKLTPILLLLLALAISFIAWQSHIAGREKERRLNENLHWQVMMEQKQAEISNRDSLILALTTKVALDSVKNSKALNGLKSINTTLSRKIANLRPLLPPEVTENDTLETFVALQDSLIDSQALTIRDQEIFCAAQVRDLKQIIALTNQQLEAQKQITAAAMEQLAKSTSETRKERRRKGFWRVTSYVLAGTAIYLSLKE